MDILKPENLFLRYAVAMVMLIACFSCNAPTPVKRGSLETVRSIFPSAAHMSPLSIYQGGPVINEIFDDAGLLGYYIESKVVSRSGPFRFRLLLDRQLSVKEARVISYPWKHGRGVLRRTFTDQFKEKGPGDSIMLGKDIVAVTGATISCNVVTEDIRNTIELLNNKQK